MDRRLLLKLLASGTAATAMPATVWAQGKGESSPRSYEWGFPEYPPTPAGSGNATPFSEGEVNGIETVRGHELYKFPRDHSYHYGPIYRRPEYCEWYYIPRGFDKPQRPEIRRKLDGGMPPAPPFKFYK